jgi:hypothetical protein
MDTIRSLAMGSLAVALAGSMIGAAVNSRQLALAASVMVIGAAMTLVVVTALEVWAQL